MTKANWVTSDYGSNYGCSNSLERCIHEGYANPFGSDAVNDLEDLVVKITDHLNKADLVISIKQYIKDRQQHRKDLKEYKKTLDKYVECDTRDLMIKNDKPVSWLRKMGYHAVVMEIIAWNPIFLTFPIGTIAGLLYFIPAATYTFVNRNGGPEKLVLIGNYLRKADNLKDESIDKYYRGI